MPDQIRVVTTQAVTRELAQTAGLNIRYSARHGSVIVGPIKAGQLSRFFVMATLILGGADALMLACIARTELSEVDQLVVSFPGWEILQ